MARIEQFYSQLYNNDKVVTIQTNQKTYPPIMELEMEARLRKTKNGKDVGKDKVNKCIMERSIPKTWKEANMVIFIQERQQKIHQQELYFTYKFACYGIFTNCLRNS